MNKKNAWIHKNRLTILSLAIVLPMFAIAHFYYPEGVKQNGTTVVGGYDGVGHPNIGGDFALVTHIGQPFTQEDLIGKFSLIYFGFTYCPDVCPTGLMTIGSAVENLPEDMKKRLQLLFVTIDPTRDTPEVLADYAPHFGDFIGLTGTAEQVKQAADAYLVYYAKREQKTGPYLMDHSSYIYLMGPDGQYVAHFPHAVDSAELAEKLEAYMFR